MHLGINTLFLIPGEVGGSETYFRQVLLAITHERPDVAITLFTNSENDACLREWLQGYEKAVFVPTAVRATSRFSRIIREQTDLPRLVKASGVDVLWSPGYTCPALSACPQVTTIHDMQYKRHPYDFSTVALLATRILVAISAKRSTRLLTDSLFSASEIHHFRNVPMSHIHATLLAADHGFSERLDADRVRARLGALGLGEAPFLLAVSNSYPHKQMHRAVDAFAALKDEIPHRLVVIGQPRLGEAKVADAIEQAEAGDRILRVNYLADRDDLVVLYQNADAFLFPSIYEGFGLPVLEALMAGTPVVASRCASIPEVGGDCVEYFEAESTDDLVAKLRGVLAWDDARRADFKGKAQAHANSFSWARTAQQTLACFEEALSA